MLKILLPVNFLGMLTNTKHAEIKASTKKKKNNEYINGKTYTGIRIIIYNY